MRFYFSADELLLTEMIFNNVFNDLNPAQCNALLSCLVFQEKSNEMPKLTEDLMQPLRMMQDMARRIAQVTDKSDGIFLRMRVVQWNLR